jgi:preprotein translocase subunit YajC
MDFNSILLQAPAAGGNSMMSTILMVVMMVGVFYFLMYRPQQKKQKEQANFLNEIKKGDKIVTIGGIVAKVLEVREKTYIIETEGGKLQILRSAISLENSRTLKAESEGDSSKA